MKQYRLGNRLISHSNTYIALSKSFCLEILYMEIAKYKLLSGWFLVMACVFPFLYIKLTTSIEHSIDYGDKNICMVHSMYVLFTKLVSLHQI